MTIKFTIIEGGSVTITGESFPHILKILKESLKDFSMIIKIETL